MINPLKIWWNHKPHSKRLIIQLLLVLIGLTAALDWHFYQPLRTEIIYANSLVNYAPPVMSFEKAPTEVKEFVDFMCELYGVDKNLAHKIITCESQWIDRNGDYQEKLLSRGIWQWQPQSFYQYAKKYAVKNADVDDWRDQTIVAIQVLRDGGKDIWTCGRNIK